MKKISVLTATRAEYGLLYWLLKAIEQSDDLELQLLVSGTHVSHEHGNTIQQIIEDGFTPTEIIPALLSSDSPNAITKSMALLSISLAEYFDRAKPDYFVVLGDRFEILAACQAALVARIPIVHIHGGELTEGAIDEKVRHAVTKLASLHFTSTEEYRRRVIQLGAQPDRVWMCGALGLESIRRYTLIDRSELAAKIGLPSDPYLVVLYHPETLSDDEPVQELIDSIREFPGFTKTIIYPNADMDSHRIIDAIEDYAARSPHDVRLIKSLSQIEYLSLLSHSSAIIGNSSSGIIEAPSLGVGVVNIGDRQGGRIRAHSVVNTPLEKTAIVDAIRLVLSRQYRDDLAQISNPYLCGDSSGIIIEKLRAIPPEALRGDRFFDLKFNL